MLQYNDNNNHYRCRPPFRERWLAQSFSATAVYICVLYVGVRAWVSIMCNWCDENAIKEIIFNMEHEKFDKCWQQQNWTPPAATAAAAAANILHTEYEQAKSPNEAHRHKHTSTALMVVI